jgi:hypothetical protein
MAKAKKGNNNDEVEESMNEGVPVWTNEVYTDLEPSKEDFSVKVQPYSMDKCPSHEGEYYLKGDRDVVLKTFKVTAQGLADNQSIANILIKMGLGNLLEQR